MITKAAREFRTAIEQADKRAWSSLWWNFPNGCCNIASESFGRVLRSKLGIDVKVASGLWWDQPNLKELQLRQSHAWLEYEGLIIDVTGDQFNFEKQPAVLVTRDRGFHRRYGTRPTLCSLTDDVRWLEKFCAQALSLFGLTVE
jgi:hypothetical protein